MNLDPVRDALLDEARSDATRLTTDAQAEADARVAAARDAVAAQVRGARDAAAADADEQLSTDRAAVRRRARRRELEAEFRAREALVDGAIEALRAQRGTPAYGRFVDELAERAVTQLGPDAEVVRDPPAGGVIGTEGARRVDYTIPAVVERVVEDLGPAVEELWR